MHHGTVVTEQDKKRAGLRRDFRTEEASGNPADYWKYTRE